MWEPLEYLYFLETSEILIYGRSNPHPEGLHFYLYLQSLQVVHLQIHNLLAVLNLFSDKWEPLIRPLQSVKV